MSSGAMQSKVGNPQVYNDGDQRYVRHSWQEHTRQVLSSSIHRPHGTEAPPRYEAGQQHAHNIFDPQSVVSITDVSATA